MSGASIPEGDGPNGMGPKGPINQWDNPGSAEGPYGVDPKKGKEAEAKEVDKEALLHTLEKEQNDKLEGSDLAQQGGIAPHGVLSDNYLPSKLPLDKQKSLPEVPKGKDAPLAHPFASQTPPQPRLWPESDEAPQPPGDLKPRTPPKPPKEDANSQDPEESNSMQDMEDDADAAANKKVEEKAKKDAEKAAKEREDRNGGKGATPKTTGSPTSKGPSQPNDSDVSRNKSPAGILPQLSQPASGESSLPSSEKSLPPTSNASPSSLTHPRPFLGPQDTNVPAGREGPSSKQPDHTLTATPPPRINREGELQDDLQPTVLASKTGTTPLVSSVTHPAETTGDSMPVTMDEQEETSEESKDDAAIAEARNILKSVRKRNVDPDESPDSLGESPEEGSESDADFDGAITVAIPGPNIASKNGCAIEAAACSKLPKHMTDQEAVACVGIHKSGIVAGPKESRCRIIHENLDENQSQQ